ncbi:TBC1 domain family member 15-like [Clytia hemisphaerica]|uniref:TBC1 domain family member 15 n=1 Tax=Clytia hemisphaerica TaxID=252671 RepID=A0A7M5UQQ9_9CNID|eukprot:TCONS_00047212-protein
MDKLVYQQSDVFVHTAVPGSTFHDDIIRGTLTIYSDGEGTFVEWRPSTGFTPVEYEVHPVFSGSIEYGVVTTQEPLSIASSSKETNQPPPVPYKITFNVEQIHSIRRSDPKLAWSYVLFYMKDHRSQPALHFHNGGIQEMISCLQRYIWLTRSSLNSRLFIVKERDDAMQSAVNQFELFTDKPVGAISKLFNNTFYDTLNNFSKVTNYVLSGMGQLDLQERRPERSANGGNDDEFEFLHPDEPEIDLGTIIPVARGDPLQPEEWCAFFNNDGAITHAHKLKERIFRGGVHEDIKCEAWKYLLGFYKFDSTYEERGVRSKKLRDDYNRMKTQWESISVEQEKKFQEFSQRKQLVEKDVTRTDRKLEYFAGDDNPNVKKLFNVLMTYCMYNFDLGYVQGMSDLLAPILRLVEDEVETFWCFAGLMQMEERMFEISQDLMKTQLECLGKLIKFLYPNFWAFLEKKEAQNLYFCFRWLLISFKREFVYKDVMTLWEALWTQEYSMNFKLFICCAILEHEKDEMMKKNFDFNDILKHTNKLSCQMDVSFVLSRAESIVLQLKQADDLPDHIKDLITQSQDGDNTEDDTGSARQNGNVLNNRDKNDNDDVTALGGEGSVDGPLKEDVIELMVDTHSVF